MSSTKKRQLSSISIIAIIAVLLIALILCTVLFSTYGHKRLEAEPIADDEQNADVNGGMSMEDSMVGNGIMLLSTTIPVEQYGEYDISPLAETAKRLTATVTPSNAENTKVNWTIAWKNPSSAWASGKTVTNYVTVNPTSDGALTANVSCLQAFGEQVIITVSVRDNASIKATCTVDYKQRYLGTSSNVSNTTNPSCPIDYSTSFNGGTKTVNLPNNLNYTWVFMSNTVTSVKSATYTIPLTGSVNIEYYLKPSDEFISRAETYSKMMGRFLNISTDWQCAGSISYDLSEQATKSFLYRETYQTVYSIPYYLSYLIGGLNEPGGYLSGAYEDFLAIVDSVNNAFYGDKVSFHIKIVASFGNESYETITNIICNSVTLPASSISLDTTGLLF